MRSEQKDLQSRTARAIRRDPAVNTRTRRDSRSPLHIFSSQFPPRTGTARIKYARHRPSCSRCRRRQAGSRGRLSLTIQVKALCRPAQSHGWRSRRPPRLGRPRTDGSRACRWNRGFAPRVRAFSGPCSRPPAGAAPVHF